jgi:hypothetical protein
LIREGEDVAEDRMAITDFLKKDHKKEDLEAALRVVRSFHECENKQEWLHIPFMAWAKIEQFEEFLEHLVEGSPLKEDTLRYIEQEAVKCT